MNRFVRLLKAGSWLPLAGRIGWLAVASVPRKRRIGRRNRSARSCLTPPAARPISFRASCSSRWRNRSGSRSSSRTGRVAAPRSAPAQVAKSDPDGHTILVHSNAIVTVPAIQPNVPYDPVRDFSGITPLGNVPLVLVIAPKQGHQDDEGAGRHGQGKARRRSTMRAAGHRHAAAFWRWSASAWPLASRASSSRSRARRRR